MFIYFLTVLAINFMSAIVHTDVKSLLQARGRRLKSLRKMADLSRKAMTIKHEISASTIQAWEEAKSGGLTMKGAQRVISALKDEGVFCTLEWLLHGEGQSPYVTQKAFLGARETPSEFLNTVTLSDADVIAKELNVFRTLNHDVLDMLVYDDGMCPLYQPGDTIGGKRFQGENLANLIGRNCIIEIKTGEVLCRRLRKGKKPNHYDLQCIYLETTVGEPMRYDVEVLSASPIIWHRKPQ